MPGRSLRAVLDETDGKHGGRNDDGIGAVKRGGRKMGRRWGSRAEAKGRTCTAGRVRQLAGMMTGRVAVGAGRLVGMHTAVCGMLAAMTGVRIFHHVMVDGRQVLDVLAGLLMNRRASHAQAAGDRLKRKQGHEQPNEQFFENAVHRGGEYITTDFGWRMA